MNSVKPSLSSSSSTKQEIFLVSAVQEKVDFKTEQFSAAEAAGRVDGQDDLDIRPRVLDGNTKSLTLLDSGSQCTVVKARPGDVLDSSIKLESVGGDTVKCYGKQNLSIQIGRKQYHIEAVVADVKETILGWDFIQKHKKYQKIS